MHKTSIGPLRLSRETLRQLSADQLRNALGGSDPAAQPQTDPTPCSRKLSGCTAVKY